MLWMILLTLLIGVKSANFEISEFCYLNNFDEHKNGSFNVIQPIHIENINRTLIENKVDTGTPFVVTGVTEAWNAVGKWNHSYFGNLFKNEELFSSTFSTPNKPEFCETEECNRNTYYGIFLNNPVVAGTLSRDFEYPSFIPDEWWVKGNEWVHWGHPPCGAKRHMDLTCTSRVSVQVTGSKEWRLYPIVNGEEQIQQVWRKVLQPLSVRLGPGDALVWFPGWEHETEIIKGLSVSLSLHFMPVKNSLYLQTFSQLLNRYVNSDCIWVLST